MIRKALTTPIIFLALAGICFAAPPSVTLPAEVKVPVGRLASVTVEWEGDDVKYDVPPELDAFREYDPDPKIVRLRLIGYAPGRFRILAVAAGDGKLSDFAPCVVIVGNPPPVVVDPDKPPVVDPDKPPPVDPSTKPTAVVYVYEKDDGGVPPAVLAGLNRVNREKKIRATLFEDDATDGTGDVPEQYKLALAEARKVGLPALVVEGSGKVLRTVKAPTTEAAVVEAAQ